MSDLDVEALARTIWGEARSGGRAAMSHVASVVLNRVAVAQAHVLRSWRPHPLYGAGNAIGACLAPLQFSCWNAGDPNRPKLIAVSDADAMFGEAQTIARAAIDGQIGRAHV